MFWRHSNPLYFKDNGMFNVTKYTDHPGLPLWETQPSVRWLLPSLLSRIKRRAREANKSATSSTCYNYNAARISVFWSVPTWTLVDTQRHLRGTFCFCFEDGSRRFSRNVATYLSNCTVLWTSGRDNVLLIEFVYSCDIQPFSVVCPLICFLFNFVFPKLLVHNSSYT